MNKQKYKIDKIIMTNYTRLKLEYCNLNYYLHKIKRVYRMEIAPNVMNLKCVKYLLQRQTLTNSIFQDGQRITLLGTFNEKQEIINAIIEYTFV